MYQVGEGVEFRGCIEAALKFEVTREFPQFNESLSEARFENTCSCSGTIITSLLVLSDRVCACVIHVMSANKALLR